MATRSEMFARLGILPPIVEPILQAAYEIEEEQIWREDIGNAPHGEPWHTSFHASQFPGDDPKACGRQAMYRLMNIPGMKPLDPAVRAMGEVGKSIEDSIVWRFERAGILLSDPPSAEHQMGFVDEEYWLTGNPDVIIEWNGRPHLIESKGKDSNVVEDMQQGKRSFDYDHRNQTLTYIGLTHETSKEKWPKLDVAKDGTLFYQSRNRPRTTHEFRFEHNPGFMEQGRSKLKEWQKLFLDEELPPRPKEWKWTERPCQWCPVKPVCKQDHKDGVKTLTQSNAIEHTIGVRGSYDYDETRNQVLDRWEGVIK
jgi:hypothetical protein